MQKVKELIKSNLTQVQSFFFVLKIFLRRSPLLTCTRIIGGILMHLQDVAYALVIGKIIDKLISISADDSAKLNDLAIYLVLLLLVNIFTIVLYNVWGFSVNMQRAIFKNFVPLSLLHKKLETVDVNDLETPELQDKIQRYRDNVWTMDDFFANGLETINYAIKIAVVIFSISILNPIIILIVIITVIPNAIVNKAHLRKIWQLDIDTTEPKRQAFGVIRKLVDTASLKEVQLLNAGSYLYKIFESFVSDYDQKQKKIRYSWFFLATLARVFGYLGVGIGYALIFNDLLADKISIGQTTFYIAVLSTFSASVTTFVNNLSNLSESHQRVYEMIDLLKYKNIEDDGTTILELNQPPVIEIKNVSFKYPNSKRYVIQDLNLKIKAGEKIAIVGENGAGKTTLIKLISRLYHVTSGEILINDIDIDSVKISSWYKHMGVLFQDFNKYEDLSAEENIFLGRLERKYDTSDVKNSAQKADALNFINEYPEKFKQILSEQYKGGIRPSTGQWQKIAIARFFYRDAPILILDEPTASIDAVSEANIFDRIYEFIENKTVIIISHRFSTVRNADRIIVFEKGKIVEEGNHKELIRLGGQYAQAFKLQARGYDDTN